MHAYETLLKEGVISLKAPNIKIIPDIRIITFHVKLYRKSNGISSSSISGGDGFTGRGSAETESITKMIDKRNIIANEYFMIQ